MPRYHQLAASGRNRFSRRPSREYLFFLPRPIHPLERGRERGREREREGKLPRDEVTPGGEATNEGRTNEYGKG